MEARQTTKHFSSKIQTKAQGLQDKIPWIRLLPGRALAIVLLLILVNLLVWIACAIVLRFHPALVSTAVLSWTLGLRHALDADHISAIDLMTRRLVASGQKPVTVGTFFSLGHSTIVIITSIVVAASSAAISSRFGAFSTVGGIIGSAVSSAFLLILGIINAYILYNLYTQLLTAIRTPLNHSIHSPTNPFEPDSNTGGGCLFPLLRKLFRLIDRPWKIYPIGILFGLGFDTSSEIALLGISSIEAIHGTSFWLILIFPALFTAGMCLLDTFDGAAMLSVYTSARLGQDTIAVLYYQCVLTAVTVVVALVVGVVQVLNLVLAVNPGLGGKFWHGVGVAGDHYEVIGGAICGSFLVFGGLAVVCYGPWRRGVERRRRAMQGGGEEGADIHGEIEVLRDVEAGGSSVPLVDLGRKEGSNEAIKGEHGAQVLVQLYVDDRPGRAPDI